MKEVALNKLMIAHLPEVVGLSLRALCARLDLPVNTFKHWTSQGTIRVRDLVKVCNLFRIPFHAFLTLDGEEERYRTADTIAITEAKFRPVVFHYDHIRTCGRCCNPHLAVTEIASRMSISFNKFKKFYSEQQANNFTVDDFILLCQATGLQMSHFLDDPSWQLEDKKEQTKVVNKRAKSSRKKEETMEDPLKALLAENRKLIEQVVRLADRVEQLEKKLENVATKHDITRSVHRYDTGESEFMQTGDNGSGHARKKKD